MTPAFHFQILDKFMDVFNEQSFILCKVLKQHQEVNHEIDICPIVGNCTLDIICGKPSKFYLLGLVNGMQYLTDELTFRNFNGRLG